MQGGTYSYIYIHTIWTTGNRQALLSAIVRKVLFPFLKQHALSKGIQLLAVNGVQDHIHAIIKLTAHQTVSDIIKHLKADSADWLNNNKFLNTVFEWDDNFCAYSVSPSTVDKSIEYLNRQEEYHQTKTLDEELLAFEKIVLQVNI
ncbi:MAG: transposase [Chitinophagaceae bacterium]|nr:transposase [Chitinophagaceae bacterium]